LRAFYVGAMAGFQIPAGIIAERLGGPLILGLGTALAGIGYLVAGVSVSFVMLVGALILGGLGSAVQHPIGAHLVSQTFSGRRSRTALAGYNFSGDLGKMAFPAATAWLLTLMPWRSATMTIGIVGLVAGRGNPRSPRSARPRPHSRDRRQGGDSGGGVSRARLSFVAGNRDDRQHHPHGIPDVSAVPLED
jgi:MFS family permease